jgi:hypothetical protein
MIAVYINKSKNSYVQFYVTEINKNILKKSKHYPTSMHFVSHIHE